MKTELNDELKNAPHLQEMKGTNPFTVPDGYFESLSTRIQDRINAPKQKTIWEKLIQPLQTPVFAYSTITLVMLMCAGVYLNQKEHALPVKQMAFVNVTADDVYNSDEINDIDETTLVEALDVIPSTTQVSNQEEEDYLINSDTDESELINAL